MTHAEKIDAALDSVLRAGIINKNYLSSQDIDRMRLAMQKIMIDECIATEYAMKEVMRIKAYRAICHDEAIHELACYFTSKNDVPVERAMILAKDFWRITGLSPEAMKKE